ncbi:hypothetical protein IGJ63_002675 [Enterococcus sp. DIV1375a]
MECLKVYKFRIYPTEEAKNFFGKSFGYVRKVYNLMLDDRMKAYEETRHDSSKNEFSISSKIQARFSVPERSG